MASTGIFELGQANVASFIETHTSDSVSCLGFSFSSEIFSIKLFETLRSDVVHATFA